MDQGEKNRMFDLLGRLIHGMAMAVGNSCEVVLHDFSNPERSIIAIENGHVTGRKVGDPLDVLGFQVLRHPPNKDLINYRAETKDGKVLRSSSIFLRGQGGEVLGAICINLDISDIVKAQKVLEGIATPLTAGVEESFEHNIDEVLELFIREAVGATGKEISALDREDKIAVVSHLEGKGAFLIRYSIDRVAQFLSISKFTIYNYLEEVKSRAGTAEKVKS